MTQANSPFAHFKSGAQTQAAAPAMGGQVVPPRPAFQAPTAAPAQAYRPAAGASKYAGIKAAAARNPMPQPGDYVFKVLKTYESNNPRSGAWFHADLEVVQAAPLSGGAINPEGSVVGYLQGVSGKALTAGAPRVKAFVMASAGFDSEADYDAFDPDGAFIDACSGVQGRTYPDGAPIIDNPLGGVYVTCRVMRGKDDGKGDFYREYSWAPVSAADDAQAGA